MTRERATKICEVLRRLISDEMSYQADSESYRVESIDAALIDLLCEPDVCPRCGRPSNHGTSAVNKEYCSHFCESGAKK